MSWKESRIVDQRLQFLSSYQKEEMSLTDLCHEYGISRPTAYKWIKRPAFSTGASLLSATKGMEDRKRLPSPLGFPCSKWPDARLET
jgi:hypothetical protein